ncbi:MAG: Response regulator SaeR [Anaerolineales bacterium]|nr:Response regulator SaeR [Anaerolineales bacterium]
MAERKYKLLIVEDDLEVAEMVTSFFKKNNYEVIAANWGEDGVRACQSDHPDLVILDIRLPDIDGYEVARRLRTDRRTADVPIIFLTEKRERSDKLHGLELGADDYITKPFDIAELRLRVRNALERINQQALTNSITGLPDGALVYERLKESLQKEGVGVLLISLTHVDEFREAYGFVASDDVLRAFSVLVQTSMKDTGAGNDFLGHFGAVDFVILTASGVVQSLQDRIRQKMAQSVEKFYPIKDRERAIQQPDHLGVISSGVASVRGRFASVEQLKLEMMRVRQ